MTKYIAEQPNCALCREKMAKENYKATYQRKHLNHQKPKNH